MNISNMSITSLTPSPLACAVAGGGGVLTTLHLGQFFVDSDKTAARSVTKMSANLCYWSWRVRLLALEVFIVIECDSDSTGSGII